MRSWTDAQAKCRERGETLVNIHSREENMIIKNLISGENDDFWIGINDRALEGNFKWSDGSFVNFTDWAAGEPNNRGGVGQDCGLLWRAQKFKWDDYFCNQLKRYICERSK